MFKSREVTLQGEDLLLTQSCYFKTPHTVKDFEMARHASLSLPGMLPRQQVHCSRPPAVSLGSAHAKRFEGRSIFCTERDHSFYLKLNVFIYKRWVWRHRRVKGLNWQPFRFLGYSHLLIKCSYFTPKRSNYIVSKSDLFSPLKANINCLSVWHASYSQLHHLWRMLFPAECVKGGYYDHI